MTIDFADVLDQYLVQSYGKIWIENMETSAEMSDCHLDGQELQLCSASQSTLITLSGDTNHHNDPVLYLYTGGSQLKLILCENFASAPTTKNTSMKRSMVQKWHCIVQQVPQKCIF